MPRGGVGFSWFEVYLDSRTDDTPYRHTNLPLGIVPLVPSLYTEVLSYVGDVKYVHKPAEVVPAVPKAKTTVLAPIVSAIPKVPKVAVEIVSPKFFATVLEDV